MTAQHPSARNLARLADGLLDAFDSGEVRLHVDICVLCSGYMVNLLTIAAAQTGVRTPTVEPVRAWVEVPASDPEAGEIRRLTWDSVAELALVVRTADDSVLVRPILSDGVAVDAISQQMECKLGQQPAALGVLTCAMWLSPAAFDVVVGHCLADVVSPDEIVVSDELGDWIATRVGDDDNAVELVDGLVEGFEALAAANSWAPSSGARPLSAEQLMDAGLTPGRALQVVRGDAATSDEAEVLREHGLDAGSDLPNNVRSLLNRPKFKRSIRNRALQNEISEAAARLSIAQQLRLPVAARTLDGRELPLEQRLEELLR